MKVLVTAFKPFNNFENNYSIEVLNYLENVDKIIIDVVYDECYLELINSNNLDEYNLIVALGEARSRNELTLETRAINLSSCSLKDNNGILMQNVTINPGLGEFIATKVDLNKVKDLVSLSNDAGKFVCNNLYFHLLENYIDKAIFIHIPNCNNDINEYKKYANEINEIINRLSK